MNESSREFPAWVGPSWHHCLMGRMRRQLACPENRRVREWVEHRAEFSEERTGLLLDRAPFERLPAPTAANVGGLGMSEDYSLICRNLAMLIAT